MSPAPFVFMWCGRGEKKWQQQRKDNNNVFLSFLNASQENFSCLFSHFRFSCSSNRQEEEGYVIGTWTVTGRVKTTKQIWHWKSHEIPIFSTPIFLHFLLEKIFIFFLLSRRADSAKRNDKKFRVFFFHSFSWRWSRRERESERAKQTSVFAFEPLWNGSLVVDGSVLCEFSPAFFLPRLATLHREARE